MTGMARRFALTAVTAFARCGVPAAAHADADLVNLPLTDDVRADLVQAGAVSTDSPASEFSRLHGKVVLRRAPGRRRPVGAAALHGPGRQWAGVMLHDQNSWPSGACCPSLAA
jgi:hypothetical protein